MAVELKKMPEQAQYEFAQEMNYFSRSSLLMYLIHFLSPIPFSLGYVGKWLEQFLFWITLGGFGIWWIILVFTIPKEIRNFNRKVALEVFRDITTKYGISKSSSKTYNAPIRKPINLNLPEFDPTMPTLEHLKEGFMFDLNGKTWQIIEEFQFDTESDKSVRHFVCQSDLEEKVLKYSNEGYFKKVYWMNVVNVFQIDPELEKKVQLHNSPPNIVYFKGHRFYKEEQTNGWKFNMGKSSNQDSVTSKNWNYFNEERDLLLTIESYQNKLLAFQGKVIDEHEIIDILPYQL